MVMILLLWECLSYNASIKLKRKDKKMNNDICSKSDLKLKEVLADLENQLAKIEETKTNIKRQIPFIKKALQASSGTLNQKSLKNTTAKKSSDSATGNHKNEDKKALENNRFQQSGVAKATPENSPFK